MDPIVHSWLEDWNENDPIGSVADKLLNFL
jgi:hypothetical protein